MTKKLEFPLQVFEAARDNLRLGEFVRQRIDEVAAVILERGGVLFRGFNVTTAADYQAVIDVLGAQPMEYIYKSTPRTHVYRDVFTATEYPAQLEIPLHCENAYQHTWPLWISFCCLTAATGGGGQTPIADMRKVTAAIAPDVVDRFAQLGVKYIRHYRAHVDLPWQEVFKTNDRKEVARYCDENDIRHEWLENEVLRTEQVCQGLAKHPATGEQIFFNQAHLFHVSSLGPKVAADMVRFFGRERLPRNATFGDGQEISAQDLESVRAAFNSAAVDWDWQTGDVVVLDNMQYAHGRRAYSGERRVLASLLRPYRTTHRAQAEQRRVAEAAP